MSPRGPSISINNPYKFQGYTSKGNGDNVVRSIHTNIEMYGWTEGKTRSPASLLGRMGETI